MAVAGAAPSPGVGGSSAPLGTTGTTVFSYQGRVLAGGSPFTGTGLFKAALVDAAGTILWNNSGTTIEPVAGTPVPVTSGVFSLPLGAEGGPVPLSVLLQPGLKLRVWFSDGAHGYEQLSPDAHLPALPTAVLASGVQPGALTAEKLGAGAVTGAKLAAGVLPADKFAPGALVANLTAGGSTIPSGTAMFSTVAADPNFTTAGYTALGPVSFLPEAWTNRTSSQVAPPTPRSDSAGVWTGSEWVVWGGNETPAGASTLVASTGARFDPALNLWRPMTAAPISGRSGHTAVWTGSDVIFWGGGDAAGVHADGAFYTPATDSWSYLPNEGVIPPRYDRSAVWTGSEIIIWGGVIGRQTRPDGRPEYSVDNAAQAVKGLRYNPVTGTTSAITAPTGTGGRISHSLTWTGTEVVLWGGASVLSVDSGTGSVTASTPLGTGARFNPATGAWSTVTTTAAPSARLNHSAVWTGSRLVIWGGGGNTTLAAAGGLYNPATDSWTATATSGAPAARTLHSAAWKGREMLIYGGEANAILLASGGRYDPVANTWQPLTTTGAPPPVSRPLSAWTGAEWLFFGGSNGTGLRVDQCASYTPATTLYLYEKQ